jgi:hypothetical protein
LSFPGSVANALCNCSPPACSPAIRSYTVPPGRKPAPNNDSSQPHTSTTAAPDRRRCSARSAHSANSGARSAAASSHGNGANHTSSPAAAASFPATLSRTGSPPEIRTAVQCKSSPITCISRRTMPASNCSRLLTPPGENPVS